MAILTSIIGVIVGIALIALVLSAFFMWLGGKIVGIKTATFGRAFLAALATTIATWMLAWLLSLIPGIGTVIGFILGAILTIFILKAAFEIKDYGKAFLVWLFYLAAQGIAILIAVFTFGGILLDRVVG